ncbi:carbohydrate ABC transporter permease [Paenibacillus soyae]|uniref:Carbohydrate ABC transporter permease n=1 Tax=Paenibacillus soyae TaxID=2969249 RepID=A0A9X2MYD7_9BACL|nr:carbohydrate ABC transporter permease [Paenibacillus soyae]MCR2805737.1 carbohydrate ABC transporter permease [Paenibacillus soyae]
MKINLSRIILWAFLLAVAFLILFPVVMAFLGSFKTNAEVTAGGTIFPAEWQFSNYLYAWKEANFARYSWNSLFVSAVTTAATLVIVSMAAYAVDRLSFPGKKLFVGIQAATMFVTIGAVVLRPQFELMIDLKLHTSLWGVILILISAHASVFFILLSYMKSVPRDLDEAAMIDGASFLRTYRSVILPLLAPGLGVAGLFTFRYAWNEFILPQVFTMNSPHLQTLTVGLAALRYGSSAAAQTHIMMAGACLSILPLLAAYLIANKSFMQVTAGSIKG